jgi:hypothetical protein
VGSDHLYTRDFHINTYKLKGFSDARGSVPHGPAHLFIDRIGQKCQVGGTMGGDDECAAIPLFCI